MRSGEQEHIQDGILKLRRALPGQMAALYRLKVGSTQTLRLALLAEKAWGRITISESFGSTLSIAAWDEAESPRFLDLRQGCRLPENDLAGLFGFSEIPLERLPLLLGGRLPVEEGDQLEFSKTSGELFVQAPKWKAALRLAPNPWRVVELRSGDFVIKLSDHSLSVPGRIETRDEDGRRVRLDLLRLQWKITRKPGELPELPLCQRVR